MPIYVYENKHGNRREEVRSIGDRDNAPEGYERVEEPQIISVSGNASNPTSMKDGVMAGYYKEECRAGSRWRSDFSKNQIKKAWSE